MEWKKFLAFWDAMCEDEGFIDWIYAKSNPASESVIAGFSRDVKHAIFSLLNR